MKGIINFTTKFMIGGAIILIVGTLLILLLETKIFTLFRLPAVKNAKETVMSKITGESKLIRDQFGNYGSGCEIAKGFAFTARHIVANKVLDESIGVKHTMYIGGKEARLYMYSSTTADYAILTTEPNGVKFPNDQVKFSAIEPSIGQKLITFSNPADLPHTFQNLEVLKVIQNQETGGTELVIRGSYIISGISGGCINDEEGNFVGIVKEFADITNAPYIGYATVIKQVD